MFHDALNRIRSYNEEFDGFLYAFKQIFYDGIDEPEYSTVFSVYYTYSDKYDNEEDKIVSYFFDRNGVLRKLYSRTACENMILVDKLAAASTGCPSFRHYVNGGEFHLFDDEGCCVRSLFPKAVVPRGSNPYLEMVVYSSSKNNSFNALRNFIVVSYREPGESGFDVSDMTSSELKIEHYFYFPAKSIHDFDLPSLDCWLSNTSEGTAAFRHEKDIMKSNPTDAINYVAIHRMPEEVLKHFWPTELCDCESDYRSNY